MEIDDKEALAQARHRELLDSHRELIDHVKTLISKTQQSQPDNGVKESIEKLNSTLLNMPKPEKPIVNVTSNHEPVVKAINDLAANSKKSEDDSGEKTFTHRVTKRDRNGMIEESEIKIKK